jgi:hypothetical protein
MGVDVIGDCEHFLEGANAAGRWPRIITVTGQCQWTPRMQ